MPAKRTVAGTSSGRTARTLGEAEGGGVAGREVEGPVVDVDRPHHRARGPGGPACRRSARTRSRGRAGRPRAGGGGEARSSSRVPGSTPAAGEHAPVHDQLGAEVGQRQLDRAGPGRHRRVGIEVVAGGHRTSRRYRYHGGVAAYQIRLFGDPVLTQRAAEVTDIDGSLVRLVDDMVETMHEARGLGPGRSPGRRAEAAVRVPARGRRPGGHRQPDHRREPRRVGVRRGLPVDPGPVLPDRAAQGDPPDRLGPRRQRDLDRGRRARGPLLPARARPPRRAAAARPCSTRTSARKPCASCGGGPRPSGARSCASPSSARPNRRRWPCGPSSTPATTSPWSSPGPTSGGAGSEPPGRARSRPPPWSWACP